MKFAKHALAILSIFIITSCNQEAKLKDSIQDTEIAEIAELPLAIDEGEQQSPMQLTPVSDTTTVSVPNVSSREWDKKIIKTASLQLEVNDYHAYNKSVREKIRRYDGYIAQEDIFFTDYRTEVKLSVKVPVEKFENLMNELAESSSKVTQRAIRSEDVTEQMVDTKARLEAKKLMRIKYLEFMKQSKKMSEVLEVQAEINSIQEEIEAANSRIQYLGRQAAYSTIELSFYQPVAGFTPNDGPSFFSKAWESFKAGVEFVKYFILGLISIWPLLILISIVLIIVKRTRRVKLVKPIA